MAKEELIQFEGLVTESSRCPLPRAARCWTRDCRLHRRQDEKNRIKTLAGDRVTIEMSPYDLEKGRLIFRHKDERPGGGAPRGAPPRGQFRVANPIANAPDQNASGAATSLRCKSRRDQKIVHVRIVLGAILE